MGMLTMLDDSNEFNLHPEDNFVQFFFLVFVFLAEKIGKGAVWKFFTQLRSVAMTGSTTVSGSQNM